MLGPHFTTIDQSAEHIERAVEGHGVSPGVLVDLAICQHESANWIVVSKRIAEMLPSIAIVIEPHQERTMAVGHDADHSTRVSVKPSLMRARL